MFINPNTRAMLAGAVLASVLVAGCGIAMRVTPWLECRVSADVTFPNADGGTPLKVPMPPVELPRVELPPLDTSPKPKQ